MLVYLGGKLRLHFGPIYVPGMMPGSVVDARSRKNVLSNYKSTPIIKK